MAIAQTTINSKFMVERLIVAGSGCTMLQNDISLHFYVGKLTDS